MKKTDFIIVPVGIILYVVFSATARIDASPGSSASTICRSCHLHQYDQYSGSMHAKAVFNPLFQAVMRQLVRKGGIPKWEKGTYVPRECAICHAPPRFDLARSNVAGNSVSCDSCHTLTAIPLHGEFQSDTSGKMLSPQEKKKWYAKHASFMTKSKGQNREIRSAMINSTHCAKCHEARNHSNLLIRSTFSEWMQSRYAACGIQCQDCHMNENGSVHNVNHLECALSRGAIIPVDMQRHKHGKSHTHRFPGGHVNSMLENALKIRLGGDAEYQVSSPYELTVYVVNHKAGHSVPTGSIDLRILWLEVTMHTENTMFTVPAVRRHHSGYDVVGETPYDSALFSSIPKGARVYRAVFGDKGGVPVASVFDASQSLFDNRLKALEVRKEQYLIVIPNQLQKPIRIEARLMYLLYPATLASTLGVTPAHPVVISRAEKLLEPHLD